MKTDRHTTDHVLMIRPVAFGYNEETAKNNFYQQAPESGQDGKIRENSLQEFDDFVRLLRKNDVRVTVIEDTPHPHTPDSIFPNNWVSFHEDGTIVLYPLFAENRRMERREEILTELIKSNHLQSASMIDLTYLEGDARFLESTGSLILDRPNRIVYASVSERMDKNALKIFCRKLQFKPVIFNALQDLEGKRVPIYHTNVMMSLGTSFSVICLDSIDNEEERKTVVSSLENSGKAIIPISAHQVENFAGNMLQLHNSQNENLLVMSTAAFGILTEEQKALLSQHCRLIHTDLATIERYGGGSARCMLAEVFLPKEKTRLK